MAGGGGGADAPRGGDDDARAAQPSEAERVAAARARGAVDWRASGHATARLFAESAPRLFDDLIAAGVVPADPTARDAARAEWSCFALFACVRGLVAGVGFRKATVEAIDALNTEALGEDEALRALLARRYAEYETISQEGGAAADDTVAVRLGAAGARHLAGAESAASTGPTPPDDVAELLGSLHESIAEAVVALVKGETARAGDAVHAGNAARAGAAAGDAGPTPAAAAIRTPPIEGAREIVARLERAGIACALGGSGLLAALGLATAVGDWDLTTDASREAVTSALTGMAWVHKGSDALHADEKFMFPSLELEVIRRFTFFVSGGTVHLPTRVTRRWNDLPVGSPEAWAVAYALLERDEKSERLFAWLTDHGADAESIDALLAQPLPAAIAARLRALRVARG